MLTARPNSYQNTHAKRQNYDKLQAQLRGTENIHPDKLLTDRSTYIGYLESQLERVTSACLTVQSFDQRIETVTSSARLLEEKVLNTGRLLKCSQLYAEENEGLQKQAVAELSRRMQNLDSAVSSTSQHQLQWEASQDTALQSRLDALEQRMLSKMDRALAKFLEKQLGVAPGAPTSLLPDMETRLSQLEQSVGLLLTGTPLPSDVQRAQACTQSLEAMQGVVQQEVRGLKAERGSFKDLVHDAKWAASQGAGPDQASAQKLLDGVQSKVDGEMKKAADCLAQAKADLQRLAEGLQSPHLHVAAPTTLSRTTSSHLSAARPPPGQAQQAAQSQQLAPLQAAPQQQPGQQQHERASLRRATQEAEQGLLQHSEKVQRQMQSMQETFQGVCLSLQSLQAVFQQPQQAITQQPQQSMQSRHKEVEVPTALRQVNVDLSRTSSRRRPVEPPSAASTPHKPSLRKTTSMLSPRKNTDKVQAAKRMPGGSLKPKEKASMTPVKLTSSKLKAESSADRHPMQRTINRRQRLQELYEELQALGD